jgi:hypothetical protein
MYVAVEHCRVLFELARIQFGSYAAVCTPALSCCSAWQDMCLVCCCPHCCVHGISNPVLCMMAVARHNGMHICCAAARHAMMAAGCTKLDKIVVLEGNA